MLSNDFVWCNECKLTIICKHSRFKVKSTIKQALCYHFRMLNTFLQIYFIGNSNDQVNQRCGINETTKREIVESLQNLFHEHKN